MTLALLYGFAATYCASVSDPDNRPAFRAAVCFLIGPLVLVAVAVLLTSVFVVAVVGKVLSATFRNH